jgi:hypothetical protein
MLPSGRPHAQVHRGSQTKQHTSFFVRTLTWLIDGFLLASVGFMAQTLERAKMHLRLATSRGRGWYAALACASPRGSTKIMIDLKFGEAADDPQPFVLTVTPGYVAHGTAKTLPISASDLHAYTCARRKAQGDRGGLQGGRSYFQGITVGGD